MGRVKLNGWSCRPLGAQPEPARGAQTPLRCVEAGAGGGRPTEGLSLDAAAPRSPGRSALAVGGPKAPGYMRTVTSHCRARQHGFAGIVTIGALLHGEPPVLSGCWGGSRRKDWGSQTTSCVLEDRDETVLYLTPRKDNFASDQTRLLGVECSFS